MPGVAGMRFFDKLKKTDTKRNWKMSEWNFGIKQLILWETWWKTLCNTVCPASFRGMIHFFVPLSTTKETQSSTKNTKMELNNSYFVKLGEKLCVTWWTCFPHKFMIVSFTPKWN